MTNGDDERQRLTVVLCRLRYRLEQLAADAEAPAASAAAPPAG